VIFLLEMGLGVYSLRLKGYFKDPWLLVDAMVITFSMGFVIYDIIEANSNAKAISPITKVIRAIFRFLRLFLLMRKVLRRATF
jgi:cAMP-specific phosphodiesterase 4/calcium/calmodulin-dependent 3',5'-cyclic nucleotide phosphodiesterase